MMLFRDAMISQAKATGTVVAQQMAMQPLASMFIKSAGPVQMTVVVSHEAFHALDFAAGTDSRCLQRSRSRAPSPRHRSAHRLSHIVKQWDSETMDIAVFAPIITPISART
jgi:hypothetical protein